MPVDKQEFDNFFIIDNKRALDLGGTQPKKNITEDDNDIKFAIVTEFKSGTKDNKAIISKSDFLDEVESEAKEIAEKDKGQKFRVVIVGQSTGKLFRGKTLFQDKFGFKFIPVESFTFTIKSIIQDNLKKG